MSQFFAKRYLPPIIGWLCLVFFIVTVGQATWGLIQNVIGMIVVEQLTPLEESIDLGEVISGEHPERSFFLRNTGNRPATLTKVVPGCSSCVSVLKYPKEPIQPGETAEIRVMLKSENIAGQTKKATVVKYGTMSPKFIFLYFTANVKKTDLSVSDTIE